MNDYNPKSFWNEAARDPDVRYKYISDKWASTEKFLELINGHNDDWEKVLEIGCGIGRLIVPLSEQHPTCKFYGIDISEEMLKLAPKRDNVFYGEDCGDLDYVYSMLVFQHIPHEEKVRYIKKSYSLLKDGGKIFFQFVVGEENSPYSYQTSLEIVSLELESAGFSVDFSEYIMHDQWIFIEGTK
jgi:cyclopropane fatty-acyl-phospholipid synthase-like methyltransferase